MNIKILSRLATPLFVIMLTSALFCINGCVVRPARPVEAEVEVSAEPPPPIVETIPAAPDPAFVWIGGAWAWHDHWVWEHGHYARPPHPGAVWAPHRYEVHNGRRVFIRGGWR
jgi:hypothetical protein